MYVIICDVTYSVGNSIRAIFNAIAGWRGRSLWLYRISGGEEWARAHEGECDAQKNTREASR